MKGTGWRFRPVHDSDFTIKRELQERLYPDSPVSVDEFRQRARLLEDPRIFHLGLVAEETSNSVVVGFGSLNNSPWNFDPAKYSIELMVDPRYQGKGLGRRLFEILEGTARGREATTLWASVSAENLRSIRFFERSGFVERRRSWASRLDLTELTPALGTGRPFPSEIRITTLAEEGPDLPEVRVRLYRLRLESGRDVPSMGTPSPYTFEQFLETTFRNRGFHPEATLVARVADQYVSMTFLEDVEGNPDTLHIGYTGTLREFRGRGLAAELKRRAITYARAKGYRYLTTDNDSMNAPIMKVNLSLGFRVQRTTIRGEKLLTQSP
ncbi:MAG: GNAT family N-acetyltransferase [Thermoplasmata archaeon]